MVDSSRREPKKRHGQVIQSFLSGKSRKMKSTKERQILFEENWREREWTQSSSSSSPALCRHHRLSVSRHRHGQTPALLSAPLSFTGTFYTFLYITCYCLSLSLSADLFRVVYLPQTRQFGFVLFPKEILVFSAEQLPSSSPALVLFITSVLQLHFLLVPYVCRRHLKKFLLRLPGQ